MPGAPHSRANVVVDVDGEVVDLGAIGIETAAALALFDDLLRIQVVLGRRGVRLRLIRVAPELADLLELFGFDGLLA